MSKIENNDKDIMTFKIVVLGTSDCGKRAIIKRFISGECDDKTIRTIGFGTYTKEICLKNGSSIQLKIIDTAGQENFLAFGTSYLKNSDGALLVFSYDDRESFEYLIRWMDIIKSNSSYSYFNKDYPMYPIYLVGNNCKKDSEISKKEIEKFKTKNNLCGYIDISPKDNKNINKLFLNMGEIFLKIYGKSKKGTNVKLAAKSKEKKEKRFDFVLLKFLNF